VRGIGAGRAAGHGVPAGHSQIDPHAEAPSLVPVAMGQLDRDPAAHDARKLGLELTRPVRDRA
jgi:hypothetical protein